MNLLGYLGLGFFSLIFLVGGYMFWQVNFHQVRHWKKTKAVIVAHEEGFDEDAAVYGAIVNFEVNGRSVSARTDFQSSLPKAIGKQITILYDPDNPEAYTPYSFFSLYGAPFAFMAVGVSLLGVMAYFLMTASSPA